MSAECFKQLSIYFFFAKIHCVVSFSLFFFFPNCCHGRNFSLPLWHNTEIQLCEGYKPSEGLRTEMWGCLLALGASEEWCSCAPGWWWFLGGGRGAAPLLLCLHWLLAQLTGRNGGSQQVTFPGCLSVVILRALVTLRLHPYPCAAPWGRAGSFFPFPFSLCPSGSLAACTALLGQCSWVAAAGISVISGIGLCGPILYHSLSWAAWQGNSISLCAL